MIKDIGIKLSHISMSVQMQHSAMEFAKNVPRSIILILIYTKNKLRVTIQRRKAISCPVFYKMYLDFSILGQKHATMKQRVIQTTTILIMTSYGTKANMNKALSIGADASLNKPSLKKERIDCVENLLQSK
jgi:hypothetical protein